MKIAFSYSFGLKISDLKNGIEKLGKKLTYTVFLQ